MATFQVIDTGSGQDTFYQGMVKDAANWAVLEAGTLATITKGTSGQVLRTNSGATDKSWVAFPSLVTETTASRTASAYELNGDITYTSSYAGETTITLPAGVAGYHFKAVVTVAQYLKFVANGSEKIRYLTSQSAAGGYVRSNTVGNILECVWGGTEWIVIGIGGEWTYDS